MTTNRNTGSQLNSIQRVALITAVLLVPIIGRWSWDMFDFIIMGVLVFSTGIAIDWAVRNISEKYRIFTVMVVLILFFVIWAELAVEFISKLLTGELWALGWN